MQKSIAKHSTVLVVEDNEHLLEPICELLRIGGFAPQPVSKDHAALMVILALVGVPIAMLNQINQSAALLLLSRADYLKVFGADQIHAQVMLFLDHTNMGVLSV